MKKVYSISIIYFDLGKGADYLYHGTTQFIGVHTQDRLKLTEREGQSLKMVTPEDIFPEYYIIRVNEFNKVATTPLEEWLDYLKDGKIREDTTTPGLVEAREKLEYLKMDKKERDAYFEHMNNIMIQNDVLDTKIPEGLERGLEQGIQQGIQHEKLYSACKMKAKGFPVEDIADITGLTLEQIEQL